jgi:hypothetical protein
MKRLFFKRHLLMPALQIPGLKTLGGCQVH